MKLKSRSAWNVPADSTGLPRNSRLKGVNARSLGNTKTTVGTAVAVARALSTRLSVSRKLSNCAAIRPRSRALASPTTMKFGLSRRTIGNIRAVWELA